LGLDLIKQYLIGIGFNVDSNSLQDAQQAMAQADGTIKKFNEDSNKGFSETGNSLKDLFSLLGSSSGVLTRLFPELSGPIKIVLKDLALVKKLYEDLGKVKNDSNRHENRTEVPSDIRQNNSKDTIPSKTDTPRTQENRVANINPNTQIITRPNAELADTSGNLIENILNAKDATKALNTEGGAAIKAFSVTSIASIALIGTAVIASIAAIKKLSDYLVNLANKDIEYEKLSRQLWTTKENAKDVSSALDILDANMNDLWLSPTLLKQFKQLREDSSKLRIPPELTKNLKVVQGIGLEFKRLKQSVGLLFQWIGNYILKYLASPLDETRGKVHSFNDWLVKNIPNIGKTIGTVIGVLLRILMIFGKIISVAWQLIAPIRYVFKLIGMMGDTFNKVPEPVKKTIKTIIGTILLITNPILFIIALIDDILAYFRGDKSVIGDFINKITSKSETAGKIIKGVITTIKAILTGGLSLVPWDNYWNKAKETFEKIKDKAKETWDKVKEWSQGKFDKAKEFIAGAKEKVEAFASGNVNNTTASYITSSNTQNSSTTANSNNKVTNNNNINIYGNDAKSNANEVNKATVGISTRNLQGVLS
jgi:hypothetical protein